MIRPTGRCIALASAGLVPAALPTIVDASLWVVFVGWLAVLLALLLLELLLLPGRRAVRVEAHAPDVLHFGGEAQLTVHGASTRRVDVEVRLACSGDVEPIPPVRLPLRRGVTALAHAPLRPRRRGTIRCSALHVRWRGPSGLLWREAELPLDLVVRVVPDVRSMRARALRLVSRREFQVGLKVERYVGDGSEFESLREFVAGMDRRAVDWKASARHRQVLCREFRAERDHQVVLCIDAGRLMAEPLHGMPRLDHAIHAALQLGYVCLRTGDRVGLFTFADRGISLVLPQSGVHALDFVQSRLAELDYSAAETNFTLSITELLQRLRRRTLVVLFTDFVDSITAELMLPNVQWLARKHLLLFVALRDPLLRELAGREPRSVEDLHRAVIAQEIAQERELVLERIRRAGAQVVDAEVDELAPELIDRYLQVKRRELV